MLTEFAGIAKELNLPQEAAQRLVDLQAKASQKSAESMKARIAEYYAPVGGPPDTWEGLAKADPEIGGAKFDENMTLISKARDRFGTPKLLEVLNLTGAANHPEVLRFFLRTGKAISEDGFVAARGGAGGRKPDAEVFYGSKS